MRLRLSELFSRLNASYWFIPLVVTVAGVLLCVTLLWLDARLTFDPYGFWARLRPGSPEGAQALLSSVVGAMITAISVTFSVTIVALTVAAQHFGPRLLTSFVRQTSAQVVLGTFMATFIYAVLALGGIRSDATEGDVPELTVSGAVLLVVLSIGALIYFVPLVSTTLQIGYIAESIAGDFRHAVGWPGRATSARARCLPGRDTPDPPAGAGIVPAVESGYMQRVDMGRVVALASNRGARVWIVRPPGTFLVEGTPLARVEPAAVGDDAFCDEVRAACAVGRDRTHWQDPEFALKQLVEIALRALSPGVNEPFTALTAIDRLAECLAHAAAAGSPPTAWCDEEGHPRLYVPVPPFVTLVHAAYDPIRISAGGNPAIYARLLDAHAELARLVTGVADRALLLDRVDLVHRTAQRHIEEPDDLAFVDRHYDEARRQLRA